MQGNPTYPIPLTWEQWWRLGHRDTYADFQAYAACVIQNLYQLFHDTGPDAPDVAAVDGLRLAFRTLTTPPAVVPGPDQPPTAPMVTAMDNLLHWLVTVIGAKMRPGGFDEDAQSRWSPLNRTVIRQRDDADLILASAGDTLGWRPEWATEPIPVDVMHPAVTPEIRVLCAFILCSDDVVGMVIPDDERGATPANSQPVPRERRHAVTLVPDNRPGDLRRGLDCPNFGTMRGWHVDVPGFLTGKRSPAVAGARGTAYRTRNQQELDAGPGVATPLGLAEFNVLFGANGRMIFDYEAGDFYLSGHGEPYPVPYRVLTPGERRDDPALTCHPYFKLTNLDRIRLDWTGFLELARLRYWENQRRFRRRGTIGR